MPLHPAPATPIASGNPQGAGVAAAATAASARPIKSEALFGGAIELQIDHRGVNRLRQPALGKLILTK